MDGFTGFKTAASEELPEAVAVIDPFIGHLANLRSQPARRLFPRSRVAGEGSDVLDEDADGDGRQAAEGHTAARFGPRSMSR